jgi:K+-transporting ATPase KdpF subunit
MHIESTIMLVVCVLMMIYLFYALLRPEKILT